MDEDRPLGFFEGLFSALALLGLCGGLVYAATTGDASLAAGIGGGWLLRSACRWHGRL